MFEAELYRLRGELANRTCGSGEEELRTALTVARRQQARMWELRAAIALARHCETSSNTEVHRYRCEARDERWQSSAPSD
jgi:hypothetical protein